MESLSKLLQRQSFGSFSIPLSWQSRNNSFLRSPTWLQNPQGMKGTCILSFQFSSPAAILLSPAGLHQGPCNALPFNSCPDGVAQTWLIAIYKTLLVCPGTRLQLALHPVCQPCRDKHITRFLCSSGQGTKSRSIKADTQCLFESRMEKKIMKSPAIILLFLVWIPKRCFPLFLMPLSSL